MKKNKTTDLRLLACPMIPTGLQLQDWIDITMITLLLAVGWALIFAEILVCSALVPSLILAAWCIPAVALQNAKLRQWCVPLSLALSLALCLVLWNSVCGALAAVANAFLAWLSGAQRHIYLTFTNAEPKALPWLLLAIGPAMTGLSAWFAASSKRGWLLVLLLPAAACLIGWLDFGVGMLLLLLAVVLQLLRSLRLQNGTGGLGGRLVCLSAVCAAALAAALLLSSSLNGLDLRYNLTRHCHSLCYDTKTNSMPEGDLQDLRGWSPTNEIALEVTMDAPQKLYLRSFVGEVYNHSAWKALPAQTVSEYADLFYWLHQNDFYAQGILACAYQATGQMDTQRITVRNLSACEQRLHLPYMADVRPLADDARIGDREILASGDSYTASYYPGSIPQWFALQNTVAAADLGSYSVCEQAYATFAQENYLDIPADVRTAIAQAWGSPASGLSLSQIKDEILTFMEDTMTYQPYLATVNGDTDFVIHTLQHSPMGYSVHYATLATLMLRYYGIPARYCEGYFLSAAQAKQYQAGEQINLDETYAHAWTEYYLDGVGWLPFEVTPGYVDTEELEGEGIGGGGKAYTSPQHLPDELLPENEQEHSGNRPSMVAFLWILLTLLALLIAALLLLIVLRRLRLRRKLEAMALSDDRTAIIQYFAYAHWLMAYSDQSPEEVPGYQDVRKLQLEALYSDHHMTRPQREQSVAFADSALELCRLRWDRLHRWYYRWIKCLY